MREPKYFVACTVDGFIAAEDGSIDVFVNDRDYFASAAAKPGNGSISTPVPPFGRCRSNRPPFTTTVDLEDRPTGLGVQPDNRMKGALRW